MYIRQLPPLPLELTTRRSVSLFARIINTEEATSTKGTTLGWWDSGPRPRHSCRKGLRLLRFAGKYPPLENEQYGKHGQEPRNIAAQHVNCVSAGWRSRFEPCAIIARAPCAIQWITWIPNISWPWRVHWLYCPTAQAVRWWGNRHPRNTSIWIRAT